MFILNFTLHKQKINSFHIQFNMQCTDASTFNISQAIQSIKCKDIPQRGKAQYAVACESDLIVFVGRGSMRVVFDWIL